MDPTIPSPPSSRWRRLVGIFLPAGIGVAIAWSIGMLATPPSPPSPTGLVRADHQARADGLAERAIELLAAGRVEPAIALLDEALAIDPGHMAADRLRLLLEPVAPEAIERGSRREVLAKLDQRVARISFDKSPLESVLEKIGQMAGVEIRVDWPYVEQHADRSSPVTVEATNIKLSKLLNLVLEGTPLVYDALDGALEVSTEYRVSGECVVIAYDVRDLVGPMVMIQPKHLGTMGGSNPSPEPRLDYPEDQVGNLAETITYLIHPIHWRVNGGFSTIEWHSGQFIITAPMFMHDDIERLLRKLRAVRRAP